ncbi:Kynurenine 3-monooxygenase [Paraconexibacter sp. AEG42_29]|uniref:Kynurenine 3-monooxygenase n=1 Tax=Paraconexibacter sp. AEG42_29 TaxID=2997339 RepID=A0AAU7B273_9ACTN
MVGGGTAGTAAALSLHRAGHSVVLLERVPDPGPVGAGILLQPTGMAVLSELGLDGEVAARAARVARLQGTTAAGRTVMDLHYDDWRSGAFGLGVHRGILFSALWDALGRDGVEVRTGVDVNGVSAVGAGAGVGVGAGAVGGAGATTGPRAGAGRGRVLHTRDHGDLGPFDLVVCADGARSALRAATGLVRRARPYPWGALWAIVPDPKERFGGVLAQTYRGTTEMVGTLPSGRVRLPGGGADVPCVSLFWSLHGDTVAAVRAAGLDAWKADVLTLAPRVAAILEQLTDPAQLLFAAYHDVVLRRWHAGDGLVVLGDAGHAMSPQLGQGANLALIDAWVLTRCLADAGRGPGALAGALAAYSARRRRHLRFYALTSRLLTPVFQSDLPGVGVARDALMGPAARVPWVRGQMVQSLAGTKTGVLSTLGGPDAVLDRVPVPG